MLEPILFRTNEDVPFAGQIDINDLRDIITAEPVFLAGSTLTFTFTPRALTEGDAVLDPDGSFLFTPKLDSTFMDFFFFDVTDGISTFSGSVDFAITAVNDAPRLEGPTMITGLEDTEVREALTFRDPESNQFTLSIAPDGGAANGVAELAGSTLVYTPNADFSGEDSLTINALDVQGAMSTTTVTISVTPVNDVPVLNDIAFSVSENSSTEQFLFVSDPDFDDVSFSVAPGMGPTLGRADIVEDSFGSTDGLLYTPNRDVFGEDVFSIIADDGNGGTTTATVTVTISSTNVAPTPVTSEIVTDEDVPLIGQLEAMDADGDDLTFSLRPGNEPSSGELLIDPDGSFVFTPNPDEDFGDGFIFDISDGETSTSKFVRITINPVNDVPTLNVTQFTAIEDIPLDVDIFVSDVEFDDVVLSVAPDGEPQNGEARFSGQLLFYTPDENFFGEDTVVILATDENGGQSATTVTITVDPLNDFPVFSEFAPFTVEQGATFTGQLAATDVDGDEVTFAADAVLDVLSGDITISPDGSFTLIAGDSLGLDSFGVRLDDGAGGSGFALVEFSVTEATGSGPATEGDDLFEGGATADLYEGGGGADTISGGGGGDSLLGGGGGDEISGGGGKDLLQGNGGRDILQGNGGRDTLEGGGGRDSLEGGGGKDLLLGGGGRDLLQGGGGKDTLDGQGGKDTMDGGNGRDDIIGGRGADILTGGGGGDRFIFDIGNGRDTITDFQQNRDKIVIEGGAENFDGLTITQVGDDVRILVANTRITVEDDFVDNFTASDFIF